MAKGRTSLDASSAWFAGLCAIGLYNPDNDKDFCLLTPETVHLMRGLAGKIEAISSLQLKLFTIKFDCDPPADNEQHFFA